MREESNTQESLFPQFFNSEDMDNLTTIVASSPWPDFNSFNKLIDSGGEIELF